MLPSSRKMHLAAKFAAITAWLAGVYAVIILYYVIVIVMERVFYIYVFNVSHDINVLGMMRGMLSLLSVSALFLFGYVLARSLRRLRIVSGVIVVLVGYYCIQWLRLAVRRYIESISPHYNSGSALYDQFMLQQSSYVYSIYVYGFMLLLFLITALVLYERTSEV
jgi:hypothetical protein